MLERLVLYPQLSTLPLMRQLNLEPQHVGETSFKRNRIRIFFFRATGRLCFQPILLAGLVRILLSKSLRITNRETFLCDLSCHVDTMARA